MLTIMRDELDGKPTRREMDHEIIRCPFLNIKDYFKSIVKKRRYLQFKISLTSNKPGFNINEISCYISFKRNLQSCVDLGPSISFLNFLTFDDIFCSLV